ncbi:calcium:proton antiporter [Paracoccus suum]|uniref:Calcium:proton antiporter n=1 Tax=Paracoccus suum TaxID=2259340 RepID=A0A344PGQ6_9RHOB|nr:calcium:proton antiporter [Paracoccus suum]AXC48561.1 calcium:proton antiporter [Paracoccus suum]
MPILTRIRQESPLLSLALTWLALQSYAAPTSGVAGLAMFIWLFIVMIWGAGGVLHHAEAVAERLGEPLGTLVLTLAVVGIEVALIASVMLTGESKPTLARDTMFAVVMIVLNLLTGISLLLGALKFGEQNYNLAGARAFLSLMLPLAIFSMILPAYTTSHRTPTFSSFQALFFSIVTIVLYGLFLLMQTVRHRGYFTEPEEPKVEEHGHAQYATWVHALLMLATLVPIVLLSKTLAKFVDLGLDSLGLPAALGGVLIAMIVLIPEGSSAVKAALRNRLQRAINLCLGAALSTIGLTVPVALGIGAWLGQDVVLGLSPVNQILLATSLMTAILTFGTARTNVLHGAVHIVMFLAYLALIFAP